MGYWSINPAISVRLRLSRETRLLSNASMSCMNPAGMKTNRNVRSMAAIVKPEATITIATVCLTRGMLRSICRGFWPVRLPD